MPKKKPKTIAEIFDDMEELGELEEQKKAPVKSSNMAEFFKQAEAEKAARAKTSSMTAFMDKAYAEKERREAEQNQNQFSLWREIRDEVDDNYSFQSWRGKLATNLEVLYQIARSYSKDVYLDAKHSFKNSKFGGAVMSTAGWLKRKTNNGMDHLHNFGRKAADLFGIACDAVKKGSVYLYEIERNGAKEAKKRIVKSRDFQKTVEFLRRSRNKVKETGRKFAKGFRKLFGIHEPTPEELKAKQEKKAEKKKKKEEEKKKKEEEKKKKEEEKKEEEKKKKEEEEKQKKELEQNYDDFVYELRENDFLEENTKMKLKKAVGAVADGVEKVNQELEKVKSRVQKSLNNKIRKANIDEIMHRRRDKTYLSRKNKAIQEIHKDKLMHNKLKYRLDIESLRKRLDSVRNKKNAAANEGNVQEKGLFDKLKDGVMGSIDNAMAIKDGITNVYNQSMKSYLNDFSNFKTNLTKLIENKPEKVEDPKKVEVNKNVKDYLTDGVGEIVDGVGVVLDAKKLVDGSATVDDVKHLRSGLFSMINTACSYGGIDIGFATSFSNALDGLVTLGFDGSKQAKTEVLKAVTQLADSVNKYEKQYRQAKTGYVVKEGFIEPHVEILQTLTSVTESMNAFMKTSDIKRGADRYLQREHDTQDAKEAKRGAEDIIERKNLERMQQIGGMVKNIAATAASVALSGAGKYAIKTADPLLSSVGRFLRSEMEESINQSLSRKDITEGDTRKLKSVQKKNSLRDGDMDKILAQESGSVDIQHLADKARLDIALKMVENKNDKDSEFYKLTEAIFNREAKDDEIMQLFGFKSMDDANSQVIDRAVNEKPRSAKEEKENRKKMKAAELEKKYEKQEMKRKKLYTPNSDMRLFDPDDEELENGKTL